MKKSLLLVLTLCFLPLWSAEITLWHAFDGFLKEKFEEIIQEYEHKTQTKVKLTAWGSYTEVFEKGIEAIEAGQGPDLLQVYEVATLSMMNRKESVIPVYKILENQTQHIDFIEVVKKFYSAPDGKMLSLPWNASVGVLFYNKKIFSDLNLDPQQVLSHWEAIEKIAPLFIEKRIVGFTTAWPAAYHLEHIANIHNTALFSHDNGYSQGTPRPLFESPLLIHHLKTLQQWQQQGFFHYLGRYKEPEEEFAKGNIAFLLQGANRYDLIKRQAKFDIGVMPLPYWKSFTSQPYNVNIGGSSFWVIDKKPGAPIKELSQLLHYLASEKVQAQWHIQTGYLPLSYSSLNYCHEKQLNTLNPATNVALQQIINRPRGSYTCGCRIKGYIGIRSRMMDYLEDIFLHEKRVEKTLREANEDIYQRLKKEYL